ncbi:hypothetical protein AAVH_33254 [Aphelenchoides avenae]|nr:hypothetical protein AAVH_33254 [Aphelenchus avenae]
MHSATTSSIFFSFVTILALLQCGHARFVYGSQRDSVADVTYASSPLSHASANYLSSNDALSPVDFADVSTPREVPSKRRLVVRLPFANNPDSEQLTRIYRSILTQQKQKKVKPFSLPLSNFFQ